MKKIIFGLIIMLTLTGCGEKEVTEKPVDKDNQAIVIEDQIINELSFESFNITKDSDNVTHIYFEIVNNTENNIEINKVTYKLYEKEIEKLLLESNVSGPIQPGDSRVINVKLDIDLSNIDKVEYVVE